MVREKWYGWALDVAAATSYGVHEVLDCVELFEERAGEEVIKNVLPALLGAMGGSGVKARPSELIKGLLVVWDLTRTAEEPTRLAGSKGAKWGVGEGAVDPSTCNGPSKQLEKRCPLFERCESELKSHLCDDPKYVIQKVVCAVCGRPLIVSPEESDARGSYNPMAACNYCKRQGRLEDLKRGD
jgi:hypothetical protein